MNRKIKSIMAYQGITVAEIARKAGVSRTWVSLVLHRKKPSRRIREAIADALGEKYESLWDNHKGISHN